MSEPEGDERKIYHGYIFFSVSAFRGTLTLFADAKRPGFIKCGVRSTVLKDNFVIYIKVAVHEYLTHDRSD